MRRTLAALTAARVALAGAIERCGRYRDLGHTDAVAAAAQLDRIVELSEVARLRLDRDDYHGGAPSPEAAAEIARLRREIAQVRYVDGSR